MRERGQLLNLPSDLKGNYSGRACGYKGFQIPETSLYPAASGRRSSGGKAVVDRDGRKNGGKHCEGLCICGALPLGKGEMFFGMALAGPEGSRT